MADFKGANDVNRWIEARPVATRWREEAILASRAALRVWPLHGRGLERGGERQFAELTLASLRANALARAAAKYPARANELRAVAGYPAPESASELRAAAAAVSATYADAAAAAGQAAYAAVYGEDGFRFVAARAAAAAFVAAADTAATAAFVAAAAATAAGAGRAAAGTAAAAARGAIWRTVSVDAAFLESSLDAHRVIEYPLWGTQHGIGAPGSAGQPASAPNEIVEHWRQLKSALPKRAGENWQVWLDWYDAVLNGRRPWPALDEKQREDLTVAIALIGQEIWRQGPAVANAAVKRLVDEAHAKVEKPPEQKEEATPRIPPPKPAAIEPAWRRGQLVEPRDAFAADLSPEEFLAALRAARADCDELVRDVRAEVEEAERLGRTPNLDMRPANYLERAASRIGDAVPSAIELFRFGHAAEALRHGLKAVEETWPDFLAARYGLLVAQLERAARQARAWRALLKNAADDVPPREVVEAAPRYAIEFAEILREAAAALDEPPLIAAAIPDGLDALAGIAEERAEIAGSATPEIDAGAEALAVDLIDSIDNVVKKLAEAWLATRGPLGAVAKRTGAAFGDGLSDDLPKQSKKLGKLMARIVVWGPMLGGAGFLAEHFAWFAPIAKLLMKLVAG